MYSINGVLRRRLGCLKLKKLRLASSVPKECFPVYVGENKKRFVVPLKYLSSPIFQSILDQSVEDLGGKFEGPIALTCDVKMFKEVLKRVRRLEKEEDDGHENKEYYYHCNHRESQSYQFLDLVESFNLHGQIVST